MRRSGRASSPAFGANTSSTRSIPVAPRCDPSILDLSRACRDRPDRHVEASAAHTERPELAADRATELLRRQEPLHPERARLLLRAAARGVSQSRELREPFVARTELVELARASVPLGADGLDRPAVPSQEPFYRREALLHLGEPRRIERHAPSVRPELARSVLDRSARRVDLRGEAFEARVEARHGAELLGHAGERLGRGAVVRVERTLRSRRRARELLGVAQPPLLLLERAVLARLRIDRVDLVHVRAEEILAVEPPARTHIEIDQSGGRRCELARRLGHRTTAPGQPPERIQELELTRRIRQRVMLVLGRHVDEPAGDARELAGGDEPPVHVCASAASRANEPPHDELVVAVDPRAFEPRTHLGRVAEIEERFHLGLARAAAHDIGRRPRPEHQGERLDEDRLPGPGLAGDHVEPSGELELEAVDDGDVADA